MFTDGENIKPEPKTAVLVTLSDVTPEQVSWIWNLRVPRGKLTLMEGDPGQGKSWCCLAIAAAVSKGVSLPGEVKIPAKEPENVLLLTAEDGLADTIRPRLEGMGADLTKIDELTAVRTKDLESQFSIDQDIEVLEDAITKKPYGLIVIDPLNAYLGDVDTFKDSAVRSVLAPLTKLAEEYGVAIIGIRHLTKSTKDRSIYRGQGSIAFTATARVVHLVGSHPNNKDERVMACIKNNLTKFAPSVVFSLTEAGGFQWKGECDLTADDLMGTGDENTTKNNVREDAKQFLLETLKNGERPVSEIEQESRAAGLSWATVKRAKADLGNVKASKIGYGDRGSWHWLLVEEEKKNVYTGEETMETLTPAAVEAVFATPNA